MYVDRARDPSGSSRFGSEACFQARLVPASINRPPKIALWVPSFGNSTPLQSSYVSRPASHLSMEALACRGSLPSSRHHRVRSLARGFPKSPLCSAHRLSQPLDGFLRTPTWRACSIPPPRPGFIPSRGFSLRAASLPSSRRCAPSSLSPRTLTGRSRLPPSSASTSRLCSAWSRVDCSLGLVAPQLAPLLGFRLLQVQPSAAVTSGSPEASAHDVAWIDLRLRADLTVPSSASCQRQLWLPHL